MLYCMKVFCNWLAILAFCLLAAILHTKSASVSCTMQQMQLQYQRQMQMTMQQQLRAQQALMQAQLRAAQAQVQQYQEQVLNLPTCCIDCADLGKSAACTFGLHQIARRFVTLYHYVFLLLDCNVSTRGLAADCHTCPL